MKYLEWITWGILLILVAVGCKSKQNTVKGTLKKHSSSYLFKKNEKYHLQADWLDAKAQVKLVQGNRENSATAYIRAKEDHKIWVSVKKFGFEGARLLIRPDSVFFINRLNKTYVAEPLSYIQARTGLQGTGDEKEDFKQLYDLLLGNMVMKLGKKYKVEIQSPNYVLSQKKGDVNTEYWLDGQTYVLKKQVFNQNLGRKSASCLYDDYQAIDKEHLFSYFRVFDINSNSTGKMKVRLQFDKVTLNKPVKMRFSIPKKYERIK